jgi:hypothetical protein
MPSRVTIQVWLQILITGTCMVCGPGSSVGITAELQAGRFGDRIPVGRDFPPVQTGPGAHQASCTMGTGSFQGVNYGWGVLLTTHLLLVPWSWKSRAISLPTLWATTGSVTGALYFYICGIVPYCQEEIEPSLSAPRRHEWGRLYVWLHLFLTSALDGDKRQIHTPAALSPVKGHRCTAQ